MRITFKLVDLAKQIALPNERGLVQSVEGLSETKSLVRENSSCLAAFELGRCFLCTFKLRTEISPLPGS